MPRRMRRRKTKYVTKRSLPFQLMKYAETKERVLNFVNIVLPLPATLSSNVFELTEVSQGTGINERIGDELQTRSIYARFTAGLAGPASSGTWCRFILYSPRLANAGTLPVTTTMQERIQKNQFVVWSDKWIMVGGENNGLGLVTIKHKWKPYMKSIFNTTSGTSIRKNGVYMQIIPSVDMNVVINGFISFFFKDL